MVAREVATGAARKSDREFGRQLMSSPAFRQETTMSQPAGKAVDLVIPVASEEVQDFDTHGCRASAERSS